jgi:hypothetical protein
MKSRISSIGLVLCLALACLTSAFAQSNLRYDTNFVAYNTKLCFESALGTGPDICLKRSAAGALSFERPDGTAAQGTPSNSPARAGLTSRSAPTRARPRWASPTPPSMP